MKIDPLKVVTDHVESTGSTWFKPEKSEIGVFQSAVLRNVLVEEEGMFTLPKIKEQEDNIAKYVVARLHYGEQSRKIYTEEFVDFCIRTYEYKEGIKLDRWQKVAVLKALNNNIFILTGGPGTGKTCVLKCIHFCMQKALKTDDFLFAAPTGKAARRITESVNVSAYTLAHLLGLKDGTSTNLKQIGSEVLIVDEISMLDTYTAEALFVNTSLSTKIILVGDVEQLPSVGYGNILKDLIEAGAIPCVKLEKTFRQASESGIYANIEQIKMGLHLGFIERNDFKLKKATDSPLSDMLNEYLDLVKIYGKEQVICLTPYRKKGDACAIKLNREIQKILNPQKEGNPFVEYDVTEENGFTYRVILGVGDPVLQLKNTGKVANGDVGYVKEIDIEKHQIVVKFIDTEVIYGPEELAQLTLAYAMSVHKSQGSEYDAVVTLCIKEDLDMLSRNTIYTAVTRAKKECCVVTDGIEKEACKKESCFERTTRLSEKIKKQERIFKMLTKL